MFYYPLILCGVIKLPGKEHKDFQGKCGKLREVEVVWGCDEKRGGLCKSVVGIGQRGGGLTMSEKIPGEWTVHRRSCSLFY